MIIFKVLTAGTLLALSATSQALVVPTGYHWDIATNQLERLPAPAPASAGTVPEPATWAMMVGGFGLIGFMRRRSRARSIVA